nr:hypothetical protein [Tanacetum cinerariifolium]
PCQWCTCERCGIDLRDGICPLCNSMNSCAYDSNPNSFDCPPDSYNPPHPTYETYSGDSCGNDPQFGYDCPPQFPLNYEPEPGYIENYNSHPNDYQCQPMNEDYYHEQNFCCDSNSFGFDQFLPHQLPVIAQTLLEERINETDCDPEKKTHLIKKLLYDNSSPHPPKEFISKNFDTAIKSFSPSPIPVEDIDSFIEEIDLSFTPDDQMLPGIKEDDYDS